MAGKKGQEKALEEKEEVIEEPVKAVLKSDGTWKDNWEGGSEFVFQALILCLICILAFSTRLFSVLRYESVIHEFDPWFNFRSTRYLVQEGFYAFNNWFDDWTWYPLGRFIGGTVYPGLMWTAAVLYRMLNFLNLTVDIRNVCVLLAPFMAANTSLITYFLTKEAWNSHAGLVAAAFVSVVPGYISRSVAGSYDNEAVAIFALLNTFFLWVRSVKTGSIFWSGLCALGYFYMVAAWGGYIFITNLIPAHAFVLLILGRYTHKLYISYSVWYIVGTLLSMQIQFVNWAPVTSTEHMAAFGVFGLLQLYAAIVFVRGHLSEKHQRTFVYLVIFLALGLVLAVVALALTGAIPMLTARLLSLIGSTSNIAIVKSVSEHQPTSWSTFFFDMQMLVWLTPAGMYFCFGKLNDSTIFVLLYGLFAAYFSGIMIRLMLIVSPACCVLSGIAVSELLSTYCGVLVAPFSESTSTPANKRKAKGFGSKAAAMMVLSVFGVLFMSYIVHCTWVTSMAYSSPSIVLSAQQGDSRVIFDDFREAYSWLSHNTEPDAKIMSWWDYGYQITGMGNRSTIVDNNTRNNTHIATVGMALASTEEEAYPILQDLHVDYVLVVFGGMIGYSSDDINKFLWMVRIAGGVYPRIVETDFFNARGEYRVDNSASKTMKNCLMYKMCYHRFAEQQTSYGQPGGFDRVRNQVVGDSKIKLTHLEEAYTTEHWMVRVYRVKSPHELHRF